MHQQSHYRGAEKDRERDEGPDKVFEEIITNRGNKRATWKCRVPSRIYQSRVGTMMFYRYEQKL